jgi:hypothetical protein
LITPAADMFLCVSDHEKPPLFLQRVHSKKTLQIGESV